MGDLELMTSNLLAWLLAGGDGVTGDVEVSGDGADHSES